MRSRRILIAAGLCAMVAGCGVQPGPGRDTSATHTSPRIVRSITSTPAAVPRAHPQAVEPVTGAASVPRPAPGATAGVSVGPPSRSLPQPESLGDIRQQLAQSGLNANATQATLTRGGLAVAPVDAPAAVQEVIAAGNAIARLPYRYGGGHATYEDTAYDCSGSISYVFAAAHLLSHTVASGALENWGAPGPGRWITVYANAGHTFMYVAGLRFDTVALAETGTRWSNRPANEPDLSSFSVRHPRGL